MCETITLMIIFYNFKFIKHFLKKQKNTIYQFQIHRSTKMILIFIFIIHKADYIYSFTLGCNKRGSGI